jgi:hypothetical protein
MPLVTLFGGKSYDHGSAYVIGDFFGIAQWFGDLEQMAIAAIWTSANVCSGSRLCENVIQIEICSKFA